MPFKIKARVDGLAQVLRSLDGVEKKLRRKLLRKAVDAAAREILKAARSRAPVRTGLLRKSLGKRVKVYASGVVVALVGPRSGFKRKVVIGADGKGALADSKRGKALLAAGGEEQIANPVRYAHLVELGTRTHAAKPFLRPALNQAEAAAVAAAARIIRDGLAGR